jgi:hypothetical protein
VTQVPSFSQPERRSFALPVILALAVLGIAAFFYVRHFPQNSITVDHVQTSVLPEITVFKSQTQVIGPPETDYALIVATQIRVTNGGGSPFTLDDYKLTLTNDKGEQETEPAIYHSKLPNLELIYPNLKPLATNILERDTVVQPRQTADGTILFVLNVPQSMWDNRQSATLEIDVYNQSPITLTIPK